jgi:activator of HSP90 ATPase
MSRQITRRDFSARIVGGGIAFGVTATARDAGAAEEIFRTAESIHQEVVIKATAGRIYEALTDANQFTKVTTFSPVMNAAPARIGRAEGESFTLFGGHIVGRHVELVPSRRIVQAWRVVDWDAGVYSIARFDLIDRDRETTIVFDHIGFPNGKAEHLAEGWRLNYWEPLEKYFR